jgi:hypothetical protein
VIAFNSGGDAMWRASYMEDHTLWNFPFPDPLESGKTDGRYVSLAFDAKGARRAAGVEHHINFTLFNLAEGRELWSRSENARVFFNHELLFSPDGNEIVASMYAKGRGMVQIRDSASGELVCETTMGSDALFFRDARPMGVSDRGTLTIADLKDAAALAPMRPRPDGGYGTELMFSADGRVCAEIMRNGEIDIWELTKKEKRATLRRTGRPATTRGRERAAFSADGSRLAAIDGEHLKVWDTRTSAELGRLRLRGALFLFDAPESEPERLLLLEQDGRVLRWILGTPEPASLSNLSDWKQVDFDRVRLSTNRKHVAYDDGNHVSVWELPSGKRTAHLSVQPSYSWRRRRRQCARA